MSMWCSGFGGLPAQLGSKIASHLIFFFLKSIGSIFYGVYCEWLKLSTVHIVWMHYSGVHITFSKMDFQSCQMLEHLYMYIQKKKTGFVTGRIILKIGACSVTAPQQHCIPKHYASWCYNYLLWFYCCTYYHRMLEGDCFLLYKLILLGRSLHR